MSDQLMEASAKYTAAENMLVKKLFRKPDYEGAADAFVKAGNLFKICQNYQRAGESFGRAFQLYQREKSMGQAQQALNNAINCYNIVDPTKSAELLEELIKEYASTGKFLQAGKACIQQAERLEENQQWVDARKCYDRAIELLKAETNADSDMRNAQTKCAEILAVREHNYLQAAKMFEEIGTKCLKIKLLQFHARGFFFEAFLCLLLLDDEVSLEEAYNRYNAMDPNMDGSAEGDFMKECLEAVQEQSKDKYLQAYVKLNGRSNLRGNLVAKTLIANGQGLFKDDTAEVNNAEGNNSGENVEVADKNDEDLL